MPQGDSNGVVKREVEDEDDKKCIASLSAGRMKKLTGSNNASPKSTPKVKKEVGNVKKEEIDEDFEKPSSMKASSKTVTKASAKIKKEEAEKEMAKKRKKGDKAAVGDKDAKKGKEEFDLPGQKRKAPEERDPLRIFYETLYNQVPTSEMASIWMMEAGLLPEEEAEKVFERKQNKARAKKLSSPAKTVVTVKKVESVKVVKKTSMSQVSTAKKKTPPSKIVTKQEKKRKKNDDESSEDDADDFDPTSTRKKKTPPSKVAKKQQKKRKTSDKESSEDDTDDDFTE